MSKHNHRSNILGSNILGREQDGSRMAPIALVMAIVSGSAWLFASTPARAACTFDVLVGGYVCSGDSDAGIPTVPLLNNGKVQILGSGRINSPATALTVGSNNIIDSDGLISGRDIGIRSTGNLIFNNTGEITARNPVLVTAGDLEMTNTRNVSGAFTAINVSGAVKLTNSGSIAGQAGVSGNTVELFNTGTIRGAFSGIAGTTAVNVTNEGTISATAPNAAAVSSGSDTNLVNKGRINGSVTSGQKMAVTNAGEIIGGEAAPVFQAGNPAAPLAGTTFVLDNSGVVTGAGILSATPGSTTNITNSGTITNKAGAAGTPTAFSAPDASITITNTGNIIGESTAGIIDAKDVTLFNKNSITSNATTSVIRGQKLTIENSAVVESKGIGATVFQSTGDITITNSGSITAAADSTAIAAAGDATIVTTGAITVGPSSGVIASAFAINVTGKASIINDGSIAAGGIRGAIAIAAGDLSEITNNGNIAVTGGNFGAILGSGKLMFNNTGQLTVTGDNSYGVKGPAGLEVSNTGNMSVTGKNSTLISALGTATIVNSGKMEITGAGSNAIVTADTAAITNNGEIAAPGGDGIRAGGRLNLTNNGQITGKTGVMVVAGAGPATIVNQGYIFGSDGVAISLTSAADTLTLGSKSRIQGAINLGGGGDTVNVNLAPGRTRVIIFDDLTGAIVNVTGATTWQIIGNAIVSVDATSPKMKQAAVNDVRASIGEILDGRVSRPLYGNDPAKNFYIKAFGGKSFNSKTNVTSAFSNTHFGLIMGLDTAPTPNTIIGAFAGGAWSTTSTSQSAAMTERTTFAVGGFYGRFKHGMFFADASFAAGYANASGKSEITSNVVAGGLETLNTSGTGYFFSPEAGLGVNVPLNPETTISPAVRYRYTSTNWSATKATSATGIATSSAPAQTSEIRGQVQVAHEGRLPGAIFKVYMTTGFLMATTSGGGTQVSYLGALVASAQATKSKSQKGLFGNFGFEWREESGISYFASLNTDWRTDKTLRFSGRGGMKFNF